MKTCTPEDILGALDILQLNTQIAQHLNESLVFYQEITSLTQEREPSQLLHNLAHLQTVQHQLQDALYALGLATFSAFHTASEALLQQSEAPQPSDPEDLHEAHTHASDTPAEHADAPTPAPTPPPLPQRPPPEPVPVSARHLSGLQSALKDRVFVGAAAQKGVIDAADRVISRLQEDVPRLDSPRRAHEELAFIINISADAESGVWTLLPRNVQFSLLSTLAARARAVQDLIMDDAEQKNALDTLFRRLSRFSKHEQSGFIHGLALKHAPRFGSWRDDARHWHRELCTQAAPLLPEGRTLPLGLNPGEAARKVQALLEAEPDGATLQRELVALSEEGMEPDTRICRLLAPRASELGDPRIRKLRKAILRQHEEDQQEATADHAAIPDDWRGWSLTRGKTAVIVGGDAREDVRRRYEEMFQLAELEWIPGDKGLRRIQAIEQRIARGGVDLVFVLIDFVSHSISEKLRPSHHSDAIVMNVPNGYGASRLRLAMEQTLDKRLDAAAHLSE